MFNGLILTPVFNGLILILDDWESVCCLATLPPPSCVLNK